MAQNLMLEAADKAPDVTLYERALSQVVAMKMAERSDVKAFRAKHLEGDVIHWRDVTAWIRRQEPPLGIVESWIAPLPVPDEVMHRAWQALMSKTAEETTEIKIEISTTYGALVNSNPRPRSLSYLVPDEEVPRQAIVRSGAALDDLYGLADRLVGATTWTEAQAVVFVLTGETPLIRQFSVQIMENVDLPALTRAILQIDPRISQRELAQHFQSVRQDLVRTWHHDISAKHLTLALFSTTSEGSTGRLADRMNRWNAQYPDWSYRLASNFSRDISVARRRLLGSGYEAPSARTTDDGIAEEE